MTGQRGGGSEQLPAGRRRESGRDTVTVVAVPLGDTEATLDRLALIELIVSAAILLGLALIAWWLVGVGLRPLRRMERGGGGHRRRRPLAAGRAGRRADRGRAASASP